MQGRTLLVSSIIARRRRITLASGIVAFFAITLLIFSERAARAENSAKHSRTAKPLQATKRAALPTPVAPGIVLTSPAPGSIVNESSPTFRWQVSNLPKGQKVSYSLRVVELRSDQTVQDALLKNRPALERKNLADTSFQVPKQSGLTTGKLYAVQVTTLGPEGTRLGEPGVSVLGFGGGSFNFCGIANLSPLGYCIGQSSALTVAYAVMSGTGSLSWTLTPSNFSGSPITGSSWVVTIPATQLPTTPGSYTYTLSASKGSCSQTATITISGAMPPTLGTLTVAPTLPICPGDDAVLTLTGSSGLVQWFSWNTPAVFSHPMVGATNNSIQNTNVLNQTTYYGVQVSSPNGACVLHSAVVPVTVKPVHGPITITGPSIICLGATGTLSVASGGTGCTYQWYCDGAPCGSNGPSLAITDPGVYWVDCFEGCSTVTSNTQVVQQDDLAVAITGPCCPCKGDKVQLCAQVSGGATPYHYYWTTSAGNSSNACTLLFANATNTSTVTVTDANGCHVSASFVMTVCP
jgi:hypothetical protein